MFKLLVEDIIEEAEVMEEEEQGKLSSQEWEEKPEEQGQEYPRTGASSDQPPLEALEALAALQVEISSTHEKTTKPHPNLATQHHRTSRGRKGFRVFRLRCWEQSQSCFLSHAAQVTQASKVQRELSVKNRLSGEQTGWVELSPSGLGVHTQKPCMPLSCLCLLICLTPSLPTDTTFPVHLHTQTVHSVTDICLAPASGTAVRRQTITPVLLEQKFYQRPNPPTSPQFPALGCRATPLSPVPVLMLSTILRSLCGHIGLHTAIALLTP